MTPDEALDRQVDQDTLAQVMACDALLHAAPSEKPGEPAERDRGYDRLRLLLTMLAATDPVPDREPAVEPTREDEAPVGDPPLLGRFEVLDHLGSGGFGFVVRARDRLLGRIVALKLPLPHRVVSPDDVHRFLKEARAAARLDHPHIVRIYEVGELGSLGYFIASELCDGPSLRDWLKAQNEPVPPRLATRWIAALADAVNHAHERGILHRDIKPDNVILDGEVGGGPSLDGVIPRLTDFGLAKLVEETGDATRSDARLGTPNYMAPEQAAGRRSDVGPATDVYALGATLYEILAGRPPFRGETDAETLRLVLESDPVPLRTLRPGLPRDLETICLKCLRKEPARRYTSAEALRDDLTRFLDGRPIVGRPVSFIEQAIRWTHRRPAIAALLVLVVALVGGLVGGSARWSDRLSRQNQELKLQITRADRQTREADKHRRQADRHRYAESLRRAGQALDASQFELAQDILHDIRSESDAAVSPGFAWHYLWRTANREFSQLRGHEATVMDWASDPDGTKLATRDRLGKLIVWDMANGSVPEQPRTVFASPRSDSTWLVFSPDGRYLALSDQGPSTAAVHLFDSVSGRLATRLVGDVGESLASLCFDAGSRRVFILVFRQDGRRSVHCWNLEDATQKPHTWHIERNTVAFALPTNGRFIAVSPRDGLIQLLDPWTGKSRVELAGSRLSPLGIDGLVAASADGRFFAAHTRASRIVVWETESGRDVARFETPIAIYKIAFSPNGSHLGVMDFSGGVTVFDRSNQRRRVLTSSSNRHLRGFALSFSSDESLLAISLDTVPGGLQPTEVWDVANGRRVRVFPGRNTAGDSLFLPGRRALFVTNQTTPMIWRLDSPAAPDDLTGHSAEAWAEAFSPDGKVLATGSDDTRERQTIRLWDPASGRSLGGWKAHTATISSLAFSPDGRLLASGSLDSGKPGNPNVILWDVASYRRLANLEGHTGWVRSLAFSPDGRWLATASDDRTARLWDVSEQRTQAVLSGHTGKLNSVSFSPDGRMLASASNDATVRLWDVASGLALGTLRDVGNVLAVAFAPDGSMLASANQAGEVKLWDPSTGDLVRTIRVESDQLRCVAFTPDSREVVAAGQGKVIRVWDIATGQELLALDGHKAQVNALAFSPDGSILASCSHDGAVKLWRAGSIQPVAAMGR
ncbi:MAG: protein kinase domain-containing protein [Isosphaeraceae bacterium]